MKTGALVVFLLRGRRGYLGVLCPLDHILPRCWASVWVCNPFRFRVFVFEAESHDVGQTGLKLDV